MLDIENYDQWTKVCDDDNLIKKLYDSGVRPGTEEFIDLLGEPSNGKPIGIKEILLVVACLCVPFLALWGLWLFIKFVTKKVVAFIKGRIAKRKTEGL